jgi:hypothetical protein
MYQIDTSHEKALNTRTWLDGNYQIHSCDGLVAIACQFIINMVCYCNTHLQLATVAKED